MRNLEHLNQARTTTKRWTRAALITAPIMAFAMLLAAPAANADGYRGHNSGYYELNHNRGYNRGYNRYNSRRHQRRYHARNRYDRRGYRYSRRDRSDNRGAYLIGGLVVGSLITHAITNNRNDRNHDRHYDRHYDSRQDRHTSRTYDRSKSYTTYSTGGSARDAGEAPVSRRLFRDAQGNCFERQTGPDNQELLIDLPAEECSW